MRIAAHLSLLSIVTTLTACAAMPGQLSEKDEEHAAEHEWTSSLSLSSTEDRYMYFEGSCHFLACCAKHDCGLAASAVTGACGTGCSDTTPWIARPNRDRRYACGECVRVCVRGTDNCTNAAVWDNSITASGIEGNIALFDTLGLGHTDSGASCSGSGGQWVTVSPCGTADDPSDPGSDAGTDPSPEPADPGSDPGADPGADPGSTDPGASACTCDGTCGYCWCGTARENACPDSYRGTGDGCDCGCQWSDPDCAGGSMPSIPSGDPEPTPSTPSGTAGTFAGVYCTNAGAACGGHEPCWPYYDCPSGSACDWANGSWGRCME